MRIAIPIENGVLCQHFGHCEQFALIDVDQNNKTITKQELLTAPPHQPGLIPTWLRKAGVDVIICGGMGPKAQAIFDNHDIIVVMGAPSQTPQSLVKQYLAGSLSSGANPCVPGEMGKLHGCGD